MHTAEGAAAIRVHPMIFVLLSELRDILIRPHIAENVVTFHPHPETSEAVFQTIARKKEMQTIERTTRFLKHSSWQLGIM